jgi:hypothetical protein
MTETVPPPPPGRLVATVLNRACAGEQVDTTAAREAVSYWWRTIRADLLEDRRTPDAALELLTALGTLRATLHAIDHGNPDRAFEVYMAGGVEFEVAHPASVRDNGDGTLTGTSLIETSRGPVEFRTTYTKETPAWEQQPTPKRRRTPRLPRTRRNRN